MTLRSTSSSTIDHAAIRHADEGVFVTADGVAIENMTARNYTVNGFFWDGVTGYRGSYLTAIDDWVYGIYAFDSVDGLLEHSYASGSWDAGFYIGQCDPCNAVLTDSVSEFNGLGYSGTNASGNIYIVNSEWRYNVAGIAPNTLDSELLPPVNNVVVAGNYIHHNGEAGRAPNRSAEWSGYGNGVVLAGARDSEVRNNLMINNRTSGVQVVSMIDANFWPSGGNEVRDNVIRGSGRADSGRASDRARRVDGAPLGTSRARARPRELGSRGPRRQGAAAAPRRLSCGSCCSSRRAHGGTGRGRRRPRPDPRPHRARPRRTHR